MFLCQLGARRQIAHKFRDNPPSAANFARLFEVESVPHGDTLNYTFSDLDPQQVQECVCRLVETLIRKKVRERYRLLERYYVLAIDGTGIYSFAERHCEHCLTRTHHGQTIYYHHVLEAKLVTADGFAFSLMSEFIENPEANPTKQDCELKAFYRLAPRLKARFPRLPICLSLDGLFAGGPTFQLCQDYDWRFMIVLKEKDLASVHEEFAGLIKLHPEQHLRESLIEPERSEREFRWGNGIAYRDTQGREHQLNVIECHETKTETTTAAKPEAKTAAQSAPKTEAKIAAQSAPKTEAKIAAQSAPKTEAKIAAQSAPKTEAKTKTKTTTKTTATGQATTTHFMWVSDLTITRGNVREIAQNAGRDRWKIENQGFNSQKHGGFELEHLYSQNVKAAKVFYFLLQIAHLLFQLTVAGSLLKKYFPRSFGSLKNFAERLREAWRNCLLHPQILFLLDQLRFQVRFDSS
jgi:hypothetical protein